MASEELRSGRRHGGLRLAYTALFLVGSAFVDWGCSDTRAILEEPKIVASPQVIEPQGTSLFLEVYDKTTSAPIHGALVAVGTSYATTNERGQVLFESLPPGRVVARIKAKGYVRSSIVAELSEGAHGGRVARLLPLGDPIEFDADVGAKLTRGKVNVTIPPGALVDVEGQPIAGTVEATVVPIDPTTDDLSALPGPLEGISKSGPEPVRLVSMYMADVSFQQGEMPLQLAPDVEATLEIALPDELQAFPLAETTVPAWWLDPDTGLWQEEGKGLIRESESLPGTLTWVAQVRHFTSWNIDVSWTILQRNCFDVLVQGPSNAPISGVQVMTKGTNYWNQSIYQATTGTDGRACVEIIKIPSELYFPPGSSQTEYGIASLYAGSTGIQYSAPVQVTGQEPSSTCPGPCPQMTLSTNLVCAPGAIKKCAYNGPAGTEDVGICIAAKSTCDANGQWGTCLGEVTPAKLDVCGNSKDDNCDKQIDEGCTGFCTPGVTESCYDGPSGTQGVGKCQPGTRTCNVAGTYWGACNGQVKPDLEDACSTAADDNCNGVANEFPCVCVPNATRPCYEGPPGTEGEGLCKMGTQTCNSAGTAWGTCFDTTPVAENCDSVTDEDCDGYANEGCAEWSEIFGDSNGQPANQYVSGVAFDSLGNIYIAGYFYGQVGLGGAPLTAEGMTSDIFLAKYDSAGVFKWRKRFGDTSGVAKYSDQFVSAIDIDANNDIYITGHFSGSLDFDGANNFTTLSMKEGFIAKFNPAGAHIWSTSFGADSSSEVEPRDIVVKGSGFAGTILVAGKFNGQFNCNPNPCTGTKDIFVRKYNGVNAVQWTKTYGGSGSEVANGATVDSAGNVILTGSYTTPMNFGFGGACAILPYDGGEDAFVTKLNSVTGACMWSNGYGGNFDQIGEAISVDSSDNVFITGHDKGATVIGPCVPFTQSANNSSDVFVAKLQSNGNCSWADKFGAENEQLVRDIAVDTSGNVILVGDFQKSINFDRDGFALQSPQMTSNMYIAKLDGAGKHLWSYGFGDSDEQFASSVVVEKKSGGKIAMVGAAAGTVDFGKGPLVSKGALDVVMTKINP